MRACLGVGVTLTTVSVPCCGCGNQMCPGDVLFVERRRNKLASAFVLAKTTSTHPCAHCFLTKLILACKDENVGEVAIVTGTARAGGIGCAIARKLADLGYFVLGIDTAPCSIPPPANIDRYFYHVGDVSSADSCRSVWATLISAHSNVDGIDCLVNNAAVADPYMPVGADERLRQWQKVLNVNLTGPFLLTESLRPYLKPQASIVHISSTRALMSEPDSEACAATKAGLLGLAHAQAISLAGKARVNTILPGWIHTGKHWDADMLNARRFIGNESA